MDSREKDLTCSELKPIRRDSMQHKPNMCVDADRHLELNSGQSARLKEKIHAVCFVLFRDLIFSSHSAGTESLLPLVDTIV